MPQPSPMNFTIRQATAPDAGAISHLVNGLIHHVLSDPASPDAQPFLAGITPHACAERLQSPQFSHYMAEDSFGACGVIALRDGSHVYHLFVREDVHGKGIARALWEHARDTSSHSTFTVNSSLSARPAYERLGFVAKTSPQKFNGLAFVPMTYRHGGIDYI